MNPDPNQPQPQPEEGQPQTPTPEVQVPATDVASETPEVTPVATPAPVAPFDPTNQAPAQVTQPNDTPAATTAPFGVAPAPASQPGAPIGSAPVPPASKNSLAAKFNGPKRKFYLLIAIIVGAVIVLGVAALVVVSLLSPSKKDYRDAYSQYSAVDTAGSKVVSDVTSLEYDFADSTTDTKFNNDNNQYKSDLKAFQEESDTLSKMKAVKTGDAVKLYQDYKAKTDAFVVYANDFVTSLNNYRPAAKACNSDTTTVALLQECSDALNKVTDLPNADIKTFVTTLQEQFKSLVSVLTQIQAIKDPYGAQYDQYSALRNQTYDIQDKVSSASSDLSSNVTKHVDDIDPTKASKALDDFLYNKGK